VPPRSNAGVDTLKTLSLGPCDTEKGDIIAILFGCSVPVVLRKVAEENSPKSLPWSWKGKEYKYKVPRRPPPTINETDETKRKVEAERKKEEKREEKAQEEDRFQLIGECYVHGMMDGEAWKVPNIYREFRKFRLCLNILL
jgi:hypothetical protein